ncbi:hypothetical protein EVG20_g7191 [Dentipellis fragilis]|uniref:Type 1 phosphatases regulator n=1 Tax=Dentipellis fragilis TaxID=205917 RepID=A0A4Y9YEV8_9AGAM|nr:hypothetical protein EVG20_g7191 [Dentipellis fragilis]
MSSLSLRQRAAEASERSRTVTVEETQPLEERDEGEGSSAGTLRLRGGPRSRPTVAWVEDVVDNEMLGRKKTKICCIYHKPKNFDESSDEDSSDSDSDSSCDGQQPHTHRRRRHRHGDGDGPVNGLKHDEDERNAYETAPPPKPKEKGSVSHAVQQFALYRTIPLQAAMITLYASKSGMIFVNRASRPSDGRLFSVGQFLRNPTIWKGQGAEISTHVCVAMSRPSGEHDFRPSDHTSERKDDLRRTIDLSDAADGSGVMLSPIAILRRMFIIDFKKRRPTRSAQKPGPCYETAEAVSSASPPINTSTPPCAYPPSPPLLYTAQLHRRLYGVTETTESNPKWRIGSQKAQVSARMPRVQEAERCRTLNLTCTFNNDDDTVALLSMDTRGDRSGSPDDSTTAEMAARIETLESAVKSLLAAQGYEALDAYRPDFEDFGPSSPTPSQPAPSPDTMAASSKTPYVYDDDILKIPIHKWATPQAAFRDLMAKQSGPSTSRIDLSLNGLISPKLSDDLLHIFGRVYQPWLPFTVPLPPSSQILLLSMYVLAFRHLPVSARRTSLYQALLQRFYNCLTSCMFSYCTGVETIYALTIIYKWAPPPPPGTDINFRQSWVLLNVATRFAGSMEVDHAPDLLLQIKRNPNNFTQMSAEDVHSIVEKARLVCVPHVRSIFKRVRIHFITSLTHRIWRSDIPYPVATRRSLLGTTLPPLPFPEAQPALLFGPPDVSDDASCRDARLIYFHALLEIVTEGMEVPGPKAFAGGQGPGWLNALAQHAPHDAA